MRQLFFSCSMRQQAFKRATVIDLRGRYDSARKELTAVQRWSSHCHLLFMASFGGIWPHDRQCRSSHEASSNPKDTIICAFFHRWDPASPGRLLSWLCAKNGFLREQRTVVYLFNLFHLPPFETIPADGRQPVNAVHSLLASNTDLPVAICNHPTSL